MKYIEDELKTIYPNKTVIINNKCENPVEVGTGLIFQEDGTYIVSVYNGKITVSKSGEAFEKLDEIPPQVIEAACRAEEKLKAKADELYEEFIAQKRFQIEQLKAEIEELKLKGKSLDYKEFCKNPPIYPAYGFKYCGEKDEEKNDNKQI